MSFTTRTEMVFGSEALERLSHARVAVFGLGGVGGACVEALARAGVGEFHLIDPDAFNESNLNRQCLSSRDVLGELKTEVAKRRILSINPNAKVCTYPMFFLPEKEDEIPFSSFDYVVDAIDTLSAKLCIAKKCHELGIKEISCMGCGNRIDPTKLRVSDLFKTENDPLAKAMRKGCRERGIPHLRVVWSIETPIKTKFTVASDSPTRRDVPGSTPFVPPAAGILLAQRVVLDLTGFDPQAND